MVITERQKIAYFPSPIEGQDNVRFRQVKASSSKL